jgi:hypothetical protein
MTDDDDAPTHAEIYAARALVKGNRRLGRETPPDVIRDAEWPLEEAAPYPEERTGA